MRTTKQLINEMSKSQGQSSQEIIKDLAQEKKRATAVFLGNIYGLHDGYDGSVFDPQGLCKSIVASVGGVALIIERCNWSNNV